MLYKKLILGVLCISLSASIFMGCTNNEKVSSNSNLNESSKESIVALAPESSSSNSSNINATGTNKGISNSTNTSASTTEAENSDFKLIETKPDELKKQDKNVQSIKYLNKQYGFSFNLPKSWNKYSIVTDKWEGRSLNEGKVTETGPLLSIRHPLWTKKNPRQDIPLMVFTLSQWKLVENEKLAVSAAPIGPTEICRNSKYVFALPARYNFAFDTGYEEVEDIMKSNPIHAIDGWK